jgi:hypothetical protein
MQKNLHLQFDKIHYVQKNLHMDKTHLFKSIRHPLQTILAAALATVVLSQCMSTVRQQAYAPPAAEGSTARASQYTQLQERPGLGTQLGSEIHDNTRGVYFYRKPHSQLRVGKEATSFQPSPQSRSAA